MCVQRCEVELPKSSAGKTTRTDKDKGGALPLILSALTATETISSNPLDLQVEPEIQTTLDSIIMQLF